ncbi:MAG TPA: hypothetical protein VGJ06_01435 [Candidatus Acidoferrum sp.]
MKYILRIALIAVVPVLLIAGIGSASAAQSHHRRGHRAHHRSSGHRHGHPGTSHRNAN